MLNFKHLRYFWTVGKAGGVIKAAERLHVTPQTVSGQIQLLESSLGVTLFDRSGRALSLTDAGQLVFDYAEEIFSLGSELQEAVELLERGGRLQDFRVGVADAVPKAIAYRLLQPALTLPEKVRLACREWKLDSLMSELAVHRLDLVIADAPIPQSVSVRAFSHRLGESGMSFFAREDLAASLEGTFPGSLDGAPMLLPGEDAAIRSRLEGWFKRLEIRPQVRGDFDDSALMRAFGEAGVGVFAGPTALESDFLGKDGVVMLGRTRDVLEEFYAISVERRIRHPCVVAIVENARDLLLES
ncbi:transcriptional activator NhaR [Cognatazoarcus halotolerans]|uniref:transcriptional activator NhaR n=1 Tax=Cognatazoarcus halotolerans TaxID=2686016 RepID=UPI0013590CFC|nr:transcriptional activator NhaR [Cognatazoarcus halotolerans]MBX3680253.1 transcriptional activator NhaR [Rhodocyclaceae bacterium]MCB1902364.1 transcriptional activator NhaR [Rhodocyclaceae bacterium]MCP5309668.1 transcriptional activator NhaR [Zoogloeaceae bacterium]